MENILRDTGAKIVTTENEWLIVLKEKLRSSFPFLVKMAVCILSFVVLFFWVKYVFLPHNKQKDKDSSKKEPTHKDQNFAGNAQNHEGENKDFMGKTQNTVIENNKSTNETQEQTHEDREDENQESNTQDSNKYPKTDNGFGTKNLKLILPVALGSTAGVVSSAAAGVTKHFSNKNRKK